MTDCEAWPRSWARRKQGAAHVCFCKSCEAGSFQELTENKVDIEFVSSARGPTIAPGEHRNRPDMAQVKMPNKVYLSPEQPFSTQELSCTRKMLTSITKCFVPGLDFGSTMVLAWPTAVETRSHGIKVLALFMWSHASGSQEVVPVEHVVQPVQDISLHVQLSHATFAEDSAPSS